MKKLIQKRITECGNIKKKKKTFTICTLLNEGINYVNIKTLGHIIRDNKIAGQFHVQT